MDELLALNKDLNEYLLPEPEAEDDDDSLFAAAHNVLVR